MFCLPIMVVEQDIEARYFRAFVFELVFEDVDIFFGIVLPFL